MNIPSIESLLAELRAERDILKKENRIERNLRIGVEAGFDCANEEAGRLKSEVEYWKKIRTENAIYFEKREAELTAERDETRMVAATGAKYVEENEALKSALREALPLLKTAQNNMAPNRLCVEDDEDELAHWDQLSKTIATINAVLKEE